MNLLQALKNLNLDPMDVDEMVVLLAFARTTNEVYVGMTLAVPDWLTEAIKSLEAAIKTKRRDQMERELKNAKSRRDALRTAEEKRAVLDAEIAKLDAALNGTGAA